MNELKPGAKLNALIAKKVFDLDMCECSGNVLLHRRGAFGPNATCAHCNMVIPLRYSTDIAAAWEVVEMMRTRGFLFAINMADDWEIEFNLNDGRFLQNADTVGIGRGDSASHAICLAALKVAGANA